MALQEVSPKTTIGVADEMKMLNMLKNCWMLAYIGFGVVRAENVGFISFEKLGIYD